MKRLSPRAARAMSRVLLGLGAAGVVLAIFLLVATPRYTLMSDSLTGGLSWSDLDGIVPWVGVGMAVFGLAWMIRIYRANPEAGPSPWRYRRYGR